MADIEDINFDDFVEAEKKTAGLGLEPNIVRIGTGIVLGSDISVAFLGHELSQNDKIVLKVQYNQDRKMIRLVKASSPKDGYIFGTDKNAITFASSNLPRSLKDLKVARGEYRIVPGYDNVFVWEREFSRGSVAPTTEEDSDPMAEFYEEDTSSIKHGDIVSWVVRGRADAEGNRIPDSIATGMVVGEAEETLTVQGLSKNIENRNGKVTVVKRHKVILRRKYDAK